ncbi:MAG: signal recognition particle-docking protein FtsY [Myxococcota bacterium]
MELRQWLKGLGIDLPAWLGQLGLDVPALEAMVGLDVEVLAAALVGGVGALGLGGLVAVSRRRRPRPLEPETLAPETEKRLPTDAEALRLGLTKTRSGFLGRLNALLGGGRKLDEELVEELETLLVTSDLGIRTAQRLIGELQAELSTEEQSDPGRVKARLREKVRSILGDKPEPWRFPARPTVVMVVGVNGVGKTTTIGKLAARYAREGKKVMLAAGDTFRAAAVEQLEVWGERAGAEVVKGEEGADPASVIYRAIEEARAAEADVLFCDTAGRLQTKVNLMNELGKVSRVMNKAMEGAPHETLMVLDATTGQNAISQAQKFSEAVTVDTLALTKLDGTAKGGVVVAIAGELGLPVRFVGVGEGVDDLRDFDPEAFVDGLFGED